MPRGCSADRPISSCFPKSPSEEGAVLGRGALLPCTRHLDSCSLLWMEALCHLFWKALVSELSLLPGRKAPKGPVIPAWLMGEGVLELLGCHW